MKDYHINVFYSDEDECYVADIPDLKYCSAFGATPLEVAPAPDAATNTDDGKVLNCPAALRAMGGDPELLKDIVATFLEACPGMLNAIREAIRNRDAPALWRAAHTLKGSMRSAGVTRAADRAQQLEAMAKAGDFQEAEALSAELEQEASQVTVAFERFLQETCVAAPG